MIKKVLLTVLVVILAYGLFSSFAHGVVIGNLVNTQSYTDIAKLAKQLNDDKATLEDKNNKQYPSALNRQQAAISNFKLNKAAYEELAMQASPADIRKANQKEVYLLDYLWMKIGTYANDSDIKVLIEPVENSSRIDFNVSGQYIAVINFIYDLENDVELAFNINNLVMQGGSSDAVTNAKFSVDGITVVTSINDLEN